MRAFAISVLLAASIAPPAFALDAAAGERFANLALACVHKEYPNKLSHALESDRDVEPPRKLTPAFYGCYDWHSAVHAHWLLARLARTFPEAAFAARAKRALGQSLTAPNIQGEVRYLTAAGRASFERPYGLAWLLQLAAELRTSQLAEAPAWSRNLQPLEQAAAARFRMWLPKLSHPVRSGEHSQTAFALGLVLDWARTAGDRDLASLAANRARVFYSADRACPIAYEPSGEDFLSPCLAEADVMRRVLTQPEFSSWLDAFLPSIPLRPEVVTDPADGKLAHLDGLNLSRAWMLETIASALPSTSARVNQLRALAAAHGKAGLKSVTGEHYAGGHWLGSFAVYLTTAGRLP